MKRIFTISALVILAAASNILNAQNCDFAQTGVRYNYSNTDANGNCIINIDLYFDLRTNSGSKYMALHIWPNALYPNLTYSDPPQSTDLVGATTLVIHHFQEHLELHSVYNADTQVQPQYLNMIVTLGPSENADYDRFTITNINLVVPGGCSTPQAFTVDMWSTESQSMNQVQCFDKGTVFYANNPRVIGLLNCNLPRTYDIQIFSIDPASMTVNYDVYIDDGDNVFNVLEDTLKIKTLSDIVINNTTNYSSGTLSYLPYSNVAPYANMNLWVEVKSASLPNSVVYLIENSCAALPVKLKSFEARRDGDAVILKWITASEYANKGFYVERKIGDGEWEALGFVNSLALKGSSATDILYGYNDRVSIKGILQYRLKQVDINGGFEYSEIRAVRMMENGKVSIFPNPSSGTVNVLFGQNNQLYNVKLYNVEGKLAGEWQNAKSVLTIGNLRPGMYLIKVSTAVTKAVETYKIIVQ